MFVLVWTPIILISTESYITSKVELIFNLNKQIKVYIMTNLSNKLYDFIQFFNITENIDHQYGFDKQGGLHVKWNDEWRSLTNSKNPDKFLSKSTLQYKTKYGIDFLRALKTVPPKKTLKKEQISLEQQIKSFKTFHNITTTDIPELEIVNNRLSAKWNNQ